LFHNAIIEKLIFKPFVFITLKRLINTFVKLFFYLKIFIRFVFFIGKMILVSMCLAGINCNYKGESKPSERVVELIKAGKAIPVCPEQLGGLPTPRSGARILSGNGHDVLDNKTRLVTDDGLDVTEQYVKGAHLVLEICKMFNITEVVLKQGSPSCGKGKTQGGETERMLVNGDGVTVALLKRNGIEVYSEDDLQDEVIWKKLIA